MWRVLSVLVTVAALGMAGCSAGSTRTVTKTTSAVPGSTSAPGSSDVAPASAVAKTTSEAPVKPHVGVFKGTGQQALGTIVVPADTTISWSCPACANSNFIINNAQSDVNAIPTNGLNQTGGVDPLPAGTYHTVVVDTTGGPWTVTIGSVTSTAPAQIPGRHQVFQGTGQQALGTIVVPADTTISWSCPACASSNFIINNAQSDVNAIPTNGLNQTGGVDPLPAGTYHTVVVDTTGGPWTVTVGSATSAIPAGPSTTTSSPAPSSGASSRAGAGGPAATLRVHLQDLGSGQYQAAFNLMSRSYQAQNPSWVQARSAADPGVSVISIGTPQYGSGTAQVPVDFYARDRNPTSGSDTRCREFQGTASMVSEGSGWRYDPSGNRLTATPASSSNPNCP